MRLNQLRESCDMKIVATFDELIKYSLHATYLIKRSDYLPLFFFHLLFASDLGILSLHDNWEWGGCTVRVYDNSNTFEYLIIFWICRCIWFSIIGVLKSDPLILLLPFQVGELVSCWTFVNQIVVHKSMFCDVYIFLQLVQWLHLCSHFLIVLVAWCIKSSALFYLAILL